MDVNNEDRFLPKWLASQPDGVLNTDGNGDFIFEDRGNFTNTDVFPRQIFVGGGGVGQNIAIALSVPLGGCIVGGLDSFGDPALLAVTIDGALAMAGDGTSAFRSNVVGYGLTSSATTSGRFDIGGSLMAPRTLRLEG